ncbi:MAG: ribosomal RNA small subunit methyltransferase A [Clostridiales bacterium]|nr:ribosomal RNA small subunit methyltransferase A [Clostridiales bacterium]
MSEYREPSVELRARVAMEKHRFHTTHSLGQNFILDGRLIDHLLDETNLDPRDHVLEIGPGAGVMTGKLAERVEKVLAVEIDKNLEPVLQDVLGGYDNVKVAFEDVMKADLGALTGGFFGEGGYRVVANLPYYITADIILMLVNSECKPESIAIMVQKEAAERLMSHPGEKQWCALAATVQYFGDISVVTDVPPDAFFPMPHVVSSFIRIDLFDEKPVQPKDEKIFLRLINAAFAMRRKTLANNLKASFGMDQETAKRVITAAGVDERVRGESLTLEQLCMIADAIAEGE